MQEYDIFLPWVLDVCTSELVSLCRYLPIRIVFEIESCLKYDLYVLKIISDFFTYYEHQGDVHHKSKEVVQP